MPDDDAVLFEEQPPRAGRKSPMSAMSIFLVVGMGGFIGANARYLVGRSVQLVMRPHNVQEGT